MPLPATGSELIRRIDETELNPLQYRPDEVVLHLFRNDGLFHHDDTPTHVYVLTVRDGGMFGLDVTVFITLPDCDRDLEVECGADRPLRELGFTLSELTAEGAECRDASTCRCAPPAAVRRPWQLAQAAARSASIGRVSPDN